MMPSWVWRHTAPGHPTLRRDKTAPATRALELVKHGIATFAVCDPILSSHVFIVSSIVGCSSSWTSQHGDTQPSTPSAGARYCGIKWNTFVFPPHGSSSFPRSNAFVNGGALSGSKWAIFRVTGTSTNFLAAIFLIVLTRDGFSHTSIDLNPASWFSARLKVLYGLRA